MSNSNYEELKIMVKYLHDHCGLHCISTDNIGTIENQQLKQLLNKRAVMLLKSDSRMRKTLKDRGFDVESLIKEEIK